MGFGYKGIRGKPKKNPEMPALKDCPFCGSAKTAIGFDGLWYLDFEGHPGRCILTGMSLGRFANLYQMAEDWNLRASKGGSHVR